MGYENVPGGVAVLDKLSLINVDMFKDDELAELPQQTFVYGKNGTGKTTLTRLIKEQASPQDIMHIYQGFKSVVGVDDNLNAISLGTINTELQPKIQDSRDRISEYDQQLAFGKENNLQDELTINKEKLTAAEKSLKRFLSASASTLKTDNQLIINNVNYNIKSFESDVHKALKTDQKEYNHLMDVVNQKKLSTVIFTQFPVVNPQKNFQTVEEIVNQSITQSAILTFESDSHRNWAREGLDLHQYGVDTCVFCGAKLSNSRLADLNSYFNDEIKKLESRIEDAISILETEINSTQDLQLLNVRDYYAQFENKVTELNLEIEQHKAELSKFNRQLINLVANKKQNVFSNEYVEMDTIPEGWQNLNTKISALVNENNKFGSDLEFETAKAMEKLRLHLVAVKLENGGYQDLLDLKNDRQGDYDHTKEKIDAVQDKLEEERIRFNKLVSLTKDESIAANQINKMLKKMGNQSYQLVVDNTFAQGSYRVDDGNGNIRDITKLSTGELNLVGFLYFVVGILKKDDEVGKSRIIVFDDPMNSNDDTAQYLIITELQKLLKSSNENDQIFVLTHNSHFYVNVRYGWWNNSKREQRTTLHLKKSGPTTEIVVVENKEDDLKTSYDGLWAELKWLYNAQKPEYMLNTIRRIFETFTNFEGITLSDFYEDDGEAKKLFDVNSHSIDDLEADLNGKDADALIEQVKDIFDRHGFIRHFETHW